MGLVRVVVCVSCEAMVSTSHFWTVEEALSARRIAEQATPGKREAIAFGMTCCARALLKAKLAEHEALSEMRPGNIRGPDMSCPDRRRSGDRKRARKGGGRGGGELKGPFFFPDFLPFTPFDSFNLQGIDREAGGGLACQGASRQSFFGASNGTRMQEYENTRIQEYNNASSQEYKDTRREIMQSAIT